MNWKLIGLVAVALSGTAWGAPLASKTQIADTFSLQGPGRTAGARLNGLVTTSGEATWTASPVVVLGGTADNGYIQLSRGDTFVAKVPLPAGKVIRVEADVLPTAASKAGSWLAVGLGDKGEATWGDGIFLLLNNGGGWQAFAGYRGKNNKVEMGGGTAKVFHRDALNHLALEYHAADNSVQAWVNGVPVVKHFMLSDKHFTPATRAAGFSGYGQTAKSKIDNFSATVSAE